MHPALSLALFLPLAAEGWRSVEEENWSGSLRDPRSAKELPKAEGRSSWRLQVNCWRPALRTGSTSLIGRRPSRGLEQPQAGVMGHA